MIKTKRILSLIMIAVMIFQLLPFDTIWVEAAGGDDFTFHLTVDVDADNIPVIGYEPSKGNYVRLTWTVPDDIESVRYAVYYCEDSQSFEEYNTVILEEQTSVELQSLKPGTVYHTYLRTFYEYYDQDGILISTEENTNEVSFLTNPEIDTRPGGTTSIELEWTDINCMQSDVKYAVYVSESRIFDQTPEIEIKQEDIGELAPVKRNGGKLSYIFTGLKPGTVYYVKIIPVFEEKVNIYQGKPEVVYGYTYISAGMTKITDEWWKLEWDPVTNTNLAQTDEILYKIRRSVDGDLEKEIAATTDTNLYVKLLSENSYYRIETEVEVEENAPLVKIISPKVYPLEVSTPVIPAVPEIVDELSDEKMEVGADSVKILWKAHTTASGDWDKDVVYDIWVLDNPDYISSQEVDPTIADLSVSPENYLYEMIGNVKSDRVIGYKQTVENLTPNTVYYIKMVAKKKYTVNDNGQLVERYYSSEPALKTVITTPDGSMERPVPPAVNEETVKEVSTTSVTLQWKNKWYEIWNDAENRWEYTEPELITVPGSVYRYLTYDSDIKFSVGYEVYTDDFDFSRLSEVISPMPMQFNDIPNDTSKDTVEFKATGLSPNTTYVLWIRAYRPNYKSELSDPIIATTKLDYEVPVGKPTIPVIQAVYEDDTSVELYWDIKDGLYYTIKYYTTDDVSQEGSQVELSPQQMKNKTSYTVKGLAPDTLYYFWINAKARKSNGEFLESGWSDSKPARTKPYIPPEIPYGFGLKTNGVGKDYLFFEWISQPGLEYILEVSEDKDDFSKAAVYNVGAVNEYKVEGLKNNTWYYARLYAYNPEKNLKSDYAAIGVKTKKSDDEYYSEIDDLIDYELLKPVPSTIDSSGATKLSITDKSVDLVIEHLYRGTNVNKFLYKEDLSNFVIDYSKLSTTKEVVKSTTRISPRVFTSLGQLKESLVISNGKAAIVIKPGIMDDTRIKQICESNPKTVFEIIFEKTSLTSDRSYTGTLVSGIWRSTVTLDTGSGTIPVGEIKEIMKVRIPYSDSAWYDKAAMSGYLFDEEAKKWIRVETVNTFDKINSKGFIYGDILQPGDFAVFKSSAYRFVDIASHPFYSDIKTLVEEYDIKTLSGDLLEPNKRVVKGEAVKILFDIMGYAYAEDYLEAASKSRITQNIDMTNTSVNISREEAASMVVRIYELKTGKKAQSSISLSVYPDGNRVSSSLQPSVRFAIEKGILDANTARAIRPKDSVTRADFLVMIKRMLVSAGQM